MLYVCFVGLQTFSLALSWSNISWTSSFQSSCRDWKDSAGISKNPDSSIVVSWSRILVKGGRAWGSTFQQSTADETNKQTADSLSAKQSASRTFWDGDWGVKYSFKSVVIQVNIYNKRFSCLPLAWQTAQGRWTGSAATVYSWPHRKLPPGHQCLEMALLLSAAPTAKLRNWEKDTESLEFKQNFTDKHKLSTLCVPEIAENRQRQ